MIVNKKIQTLLQRNNKRINSKNYKKLINLFMETKKYKIFLEKNPLNKITQINNNKFLVKDN